MDSINLERDWPPEKPLHIFGNHARALRADMMLSAGVAELVDALDLGSSDESRGGASPSARTILRAFPSQSLPRTSREVERARHSRFFSSAGGRAGAAAGLSGILGAAGLISFARGAS